MVSNNHITPCYVHIPKGKTSSCKRVKAHCYNIWQNTNNNRAIKYKRRRTTKQRNRKKNLLDGLSYPVEEKELLSIDDILSSHYYFYHYNDSDPYKDLIKNLKETKLIHVNEEYFNIVDTVDGAKHFDKNGTLIFLLIPRKLILEQKPNPSEVTPVLRNILIKNKNNLKRGVSRQGLSTHYATLGTHATRFGGTHYKPGKNITPSEMKCLETLMNKVFMLAKIFLPFGLLSALFTTKKMNNDNSCFGEHSNEQSMYSFIWSSIAMSFNYISQAHIDEDSFLSALVVNHRFSNLKTQNQYDLIMKNAAHFIFPTLGIAVALKPGDVLLFNPLVPHCVSQRTEYYKSEEVYLTSFYLKNKQISLNDNSIELSEECELKSDFMENYFKEQYN
jgi:hypothetical protein